MRLLADEPLEGRPRVKAIFQVFDIYFQRRDVTRSDANIIKKISPKVSIRSLCAQPSYRGRD